MHACQRLAIAEKKKERDKVPRCGLLVPLLVTRASGVNPTGTKTNTPVGSRESEPPACNNP